MININKWDIKIAGGLLSHMDGEFTQSPPGAKAIQCKVSTKIPENKKTLNCASVFKRLQPRWEKGAVFGILGILSFETDSACWILASLPLYYLYKVIF